MKISFIGDISLNDNYIELYKKGANPFKGVGAQLQKSDFVVGNLECMVKGEFENLLKKPRLTTTVETLSYLNTLNVKMVTLAHNHIYDHLEDGFIKTTKFLDESRILFLGASLKKEDVEKPKIFTQNDIKIGFLNFVTEDTNPNLPLDTKVFLNCFNLEKAINDIKLLKHKVDHIVLLLHWGGRVEGGQFPDWDQPQIAHELIDAGADLIIGHHPHTIQPYEIYKGKYIFYSLGNFCFSDYWFNGELYPMPKSRMVSLIVEVSFDKYKYSLDTAYYLNEVKSYSKYDGYSGNMVLRNKLFKIVNGNKLAWLIYYFQKQWILPLFLFFHRKDIPYSIKLFRLFKYIRKRLY